MSLIEETCKHTGISFLKKAKMQKNALTTLSNFVTMYLVIGTNGDPIFENYIPSQMLKNLRSQD